MRRFCRLTGLIRLPSLKKIACLTAFLLVSINANNLCADTPKAVISIPQTNFDFGKVSEGSKVQHEFLLSNKGTSDLLIQRVLAGCGCTAATALNTAIAANAESKISVSLDTSGMSGLQNKSVRVYSNDPENPIVTLTLNGTVQQKVTVEPANLLFESVTRGQKEPITKEVSITTDKDSGVKIGDVETFSKYVKIENVSGNESAKKFTMVLDSNLPLGDFRERIIIALSGAAKSSINIPVYANVKGDLQISPPAVSFGIISGKELISRKVNVENKSDQPYILKSVVGSSKALSAQVNEIKPGKSYTVDIMLDPNKIEGDLRTEMKFKAETDLEESLSINVYGVMPPKL